MSRPDPQPRRVVQEPDRGEDRVGVVERLAHAHEHDVQVVLWVEDRGRARRHQSTWSTISAAVSWRPNPACPVAQNGQLTAQPAWLEMQIVVRGAEPPRPG